MSYRMLSFALQGWITVVPLGNCFSCSRANCSIPGTAFSNSPGPMLTPFRCHSLIGIFWLFVPPFFSLFRSVPCPNSSTIISNGTSILLIIISFIICFPLKGWNCAAEFSAWHLWYFFQFLKSDHSNANNPCFHCPTF